MQGSGRPTESLTTDLSRIAGSFVTARNTAFAFKGKAVDVKQVGRELNVRYVLEGRFRVNQCKALSVLIFRRETLFRRFEHSDCHNATNRAKSVSRSFVPLLPVRQRSDLTPIATEEQTWRRLKCGRTDLVRLFDHLVCRHNH